MISSYNFLTIQTHMRMNQSQIKKFKKIKETTPLANKLCKNHENDTPNTVTTENQDKSIFIKKIDGSSKILYLNLEQTTLHILLHKIEQITNIPKHELRYISQGKELPIKVDMALDKLNVKKDSTIELRLRLKGGTKNIYDILKEDDEIFELYQEFDEKYAFTQRWVEMNKNEVYTLLFDGNCKPNPGKGVAGFLIKDNEQKLYNASFNLGESSTNNVAEYYGLIFGLIAAVNFKISNLQVKGDSALVIKQMTGINQVRDAKLLPLYERAIKLTKAFNKIDFIHHGKEYNFEANEIANQAFSINSKIEPKKN